MTHRDRQLIQRVHDAGIILKVDGDHLRYRAPAGAMTPDLRAVLVEWKPNLLHEYHERAGILEYDAHLPRDEAEHVARGTTMATGHEKGDERNNENNLKYNNKCSAK